MVRIAYTALGPPETAVRAFDDLAPWVREMMSLKAGCEPLGPDDMAMSIPLDGLQTAAFHFTRRRDFYFQIEAEFSGRRGGNGRLADRDEAIAAFEGLRPYLDRLKGLRDRCRPFGRDYCALTIPIETLKTAAFHFTREDMFYGSAGDGAGPGRGRQRP